MYRRGFPLQGGWGELQRGLLWDFNLGQTSTGCIRNVHPSPAGRLPPNPAPPCPLEPSFCQGLTVLAETLVIPRTVPGLEGRLHMEKGTFLVVAAT